MPIRVSIADGQPLFRDALARVVRQCSGLQLVHEASDSVGALHGIRRHGPRVALVDVRLPGPGAGWLLRALAGDPRAGATRDAAATATGVLLVGSFDHPQDAYEAVAEGAAGCLARDAAPEAIRDAIHVVAGGGTVLARDALGGVAREIRRRERVGRPKLSPRELEVLRRIAEGQSARRMAQELHLGVSTVKTHVSHLYDKLGVAERGAAVAAGMRRGILE
jgi:DNA-binding NarL/FixJ family response regulator